MAATSLHAVRLYRMDLPDHPCPWGLRALRLLQEQHTLTLARTLTLTLTLTPNP